MLKRLRQKKIQKKIWMGLAILIIPAFVLLGFGEALRAGKKTSGQKYTQALEAVKNLAIIQFGDDFSQIQKYLNLEAEARKRIILLAEAKKYKIKVSDEEVKELIASYPFFQKQGRFDQTVYSRMLQYVFGTPARVFEEQIRENLILAKLYDKVTRDVILSEGEIKEAYYKENQEVSIYYITSLYADFIKDIVPSEQDLKDYFARNPDEFKEPLSFNLEYVILEQDKIPEKELKDKREKIVLRLNKKEGFAQVAKDFGLDLKETGLFKQTDPIPGIGWSSQILSLLLKAKVGQILGPLELNKSDYFIKVKQRKEPYLPEWETIKDKVRLAVIKVKSQEIAKEKIEGCYKNLKERYQPKSIDFLDIARECGLKSGSTDLFKYGSYIEGIGASDNFWLATQKLKEEEFSEVLEAPQGFYIIKLKSKTPIDENKFLAEKNNLSQKLLNQKKQEYFARFIKRLRGLEK